MDDIGYWAKYFECVDDTSIRVGYGNTIVESAYCIPKEALLLGDKLTNSPLGNINSLVRMVSITRRAGAFKLDFTEKFNMDDLCDAVFKVMEGQVKQYNNNEPLVVLVSPKMCHIVRKLVVTSKQYYTQNNIIDSGIRHRLIIYGMEFKPFHKL